MHPTGCAEQTIDHSDRTSGDCHSVAVQVNADPSRSFRRLKPDERGASKSASPKWREDGMCAAGYGIPGVDGRHRERLLPAGPPRPMSMLSNVYTGHSPKLTQCDVDGNVLEQPSGVGDRGILLTGSFVLGGPSDDGV